MDVCREARVVKIKFLILSGQSDRKLITEMRISLLLNPDVWSGYSLEDRLKYFRIGFGIKPLRMRSKPLID